MCSGLSDDDWGDRGLLHRPRSLEAYAVAEEDPPGLAILDWMNPDYAW